MSPLGWSVAVTALAAGAWAVDRLRAGGVRWGAAALVAVAALAFQAVHFFEHAVQFAHWLGSPGSPPWMSAWALEGRDALAAAVGRPPMAGMELLHLIGNTIFLAGLLIVRRVVPAVGVSPAWRLARAVQSAHVVEHILLTTTALFVGRSIGVTTLFGTVDPTSGAAIGLRVCSHFALNALPTALAVLAVARAATARADRQPPVPARAASVELGV